MADPSHLGTDGSNLRIGLSLVAVPLSRLVTVLSYVVVVVRDSR